MRFVTALLSAAALFLSTVGIPVRAWNKQATPHSAQPPCHGIANCNLLGTEALQKSDAEAAIPFFKAQVGYAEDAQNKGDSIGAYNNLALGYLRENRYFLALSWTRLALRLDPEDKAANDNLKSIEEHIGSYKWPRQVTGIYVQYAGRTQWNSFCVRETRNHKLNFRLLAFRMGLAWRTYGPGSYGDLSGEAVLADGKQALYKGDKDFPTCRIKMQFGSGSAVLSQEGDCGFGYGVKGAEDYERITATEADLEHCDERDLP